MHLNLSPLTRKVNFTLLSKAIKSQRASHALGAGRLRNVYSTDTHNHRKNPQNTHTLARPCVGRGLHTLPKHTMSSCLQFYVFPAETLSPFFFLFLFTILSISLPLVLCVFLLSPSLYQTQALACCVVGLSGERGPDPEKRGGVGRLLTPGVQTAANGEQVWRREGEEKERQRRGEERRGEENKRCMPLPARLKSQFCSTQCFRLTVCVRVAVETLAGRSAAEVRVAEESRLSRRVTQAVFCFNV